MKKILFGTIAAIGLSLAIAGGASAGNNVNASKLCTANDDYSPFFSSHGECTSAANQCLNTGNNGLCICKIAKADGTLDALDLNLGECLDIVGGPKGN